MSVSDRVLMIIARTTFTDIHRLDRQMKLRHIEADSYQWKLIISRVESTFNINIDDEKTEELTSIDDFIEYIENCIKQT